MWNVRAIASASEILGFRQRSDGSLDYSLRTVTWQCRTPQAWGGERVIEDTTLLVW